MSRVASYRTATPEDLVKIFEGLKNGDRKILVRSLIRGDDEPYPLLDICRPPFQINEGILIGFDNNGIESSLRITESTFHNIELKKGDGDWYPPEASSTLILLPV